MSYQDYVAWFESLKAQGVSRDDVLDVLEFDSDQYPDHKVLQAVRNEVFGVES